jgi:hypothetical protein
MSRRGRPLKMILAAAVLGALGCSGSTPRDINYGTDAESGFDAPAYDGPSKNVGDASDAAGTGGAGTGGTAGTGGAAGAAGTGGSAAGAAGTDAGTDDGGDDAVSDGAGN